MNRGRSTENLLLVLWTIALIATAGSLFYSEIVGYVPCDLCWVQRVFMYPLVVIYGIATFKQNIEYALSGLILSVIGFLVSVYHYLLQKLPALQEVGGTCQIVPCNLQYVNYFGFITIPFLAGLAFLMISLLHIFILRQK